MSVSTQVLLLYYIVSYITIARHESWSLILSNVYKKAENVNSIDVFSLSILILNKKTSPNLENCT